MELQQLRYVLAVADTMSFTRAAQRCFVVQSSLSHQVKALESELGVRLFARTSRRVELTGAGTAFLPAARAAVAAAERAAQDAAAAEGDIRGHLTVGIIPTLTAVDLPGALRRFCGRHPHVAVTSRTGNSDDLAAAVRAGEIDVAFLGLPDTAEPRGGRHRRLARERLVAVVPHDHRLAGRRRLHLMDLADEAFADFPTGSAGRAQSDNAFAAADLTRRVAFEATDAALILDLVGNGLAVALLPTGVVPERPDLSTVPVVDGPRRTEYLMWSDFNPTPAATAFLAELEVQT
ncbi:LysR family transcriptional regulator [Prauserella alba]|uniref:LysR family transcriptional regulator n=1 Tax=Prauserella alba TaxID=176898 RepID=A0ABP4G0D4_9PSEU|nr:LysR family transcriptional regulator [Prauserella alba]MCP2182665.1 DNA-binding transcriptional regulator, LysR family [Prauserella alba]